MSGHAQHEGDEQENAERWLITYADMITLLMAFFIMMYAMSVVDVRKFEALAHAMGTAFGSGAPDLATVRAANTGILGEGHAVVARGAGAVLGSAGNRATLVNALRSELRRELPRRLGDAVQVIYSGGTVTVRLKADTVIFAAGSATLTEEARDILDAIGPALRSVGAPLRVEGHTCDLPIRTERFPSNWELSAQRAANVMAYLVRTAGVPAEQISAAGFADTRPLVANTDEAARRRNRRVDIVIADVPSADPGGGGTGRGDEGPSGAATLHLKPIRLCPPIDLEARHREYVRQTVARNLRAR